MADIQTRAGRISYEQRGSGGSPIVLLHATLHDRHDFDPIVAALALTHRTIALDWPGHGESEPVVAPTATLYADVLEEVVERLDLPPAVLIGNSVGGFAAARLAITHPERVAGLVLVNSGGFLPQTLVTRTFCRVLGSPAIARRALPRFVPSYMQASTDSDREISARAVARARTRSGAATAAALWRSFADDTYDLRGGAGKLRAPTLIVWGARDTAIPLRFGRATHAALPAAQFETLDTGHVAFSSAPQEFLALAEPFVARLASDPAC